MKTVGRVKILLATALMLFSIVVANAQNAGKDTVTACNSITLYADNPAPQVGTWTGPVGVTFVPNANTYDAIANNLNVELNQLVWTVNGVSDTVNVFYLIADPGNDTTVCGDVQLHANNPSPGTGLWTCSNSAVTFSNNTSPTATALGIPFGSVTVTWTVYAGGCQNSDSILISNDLPSGTSAGADDTTCTDSFHLAGSDPARFGGTGHWDVIGGGGNFVNPNLNTTWVNNLPAGWNTFTWTEYSAGCSVSDTVMIYNGAVNPTASNQTVCTNYATLDGNFQPGATGVWSIVSSGATIVTPTDRNTLVTDLDPNINTFKWTLSNSICSKYVDITVTYNKLNADAGPDQHICTGTTSMNATPVGVGETGTWSLQSGTGNVVAHNNPASVVNTMDGLAPNIFFWIVSKAGCTPVEDTVVIYVDSLPADAGPDQLDLCEDQTTLNALTGNPASWGGTGVWTTVSTANIVTPSNYQTLVTNLPPNSSVFRWNVKKGSCSVYDEVTVSRNAYYISAGADQVICGTSAVLDGSNPGPGGTGTWSIVSGGPAVISDENNRNATVSDIQSFPITLRWTVNGTCSGFSDVVIDNAGTTQAEIAGGDILYAGCDEDWYNGLDIVNPLAGGETLSWTELTSYGVSITPNNNAPANVTGLPKPGLTTIQLSITDGICTTRDTVVISTGTPVTADAGGPYTGKNCQQYFYLNAVDPTPAVGTWSIDPGDPNDQAVYIDDPNDPNTFIITRTLSTGNFIFTLDWTVSNGSCSATDVVDVENYAVAYAGEDIFQCGNDIFQMNALPSTNSNPSSGTYGQWDFSGIAVSLVGGDKDYWSDARFQIDNTGYEGAYPIIWTYHYKKGGFKCASEDTLTMYFLEDLSTKPMTAGQDTILCGTSITLTDATVPSSMGLNCTGSWSGPVGVNFNPIDDPTTTATNLQLGNNWLTWTITNQCSQNSAQLNAYVDGLDGINAGKDQTICSDSTQFKADSLRPGEWSIVSGGGIIKDSTAYNSDVTNLLPGRNVFRWAVGGDGFCYSEDTVVIYCNKPETPIAGPDIQVCDSGMLYAQAPVESGVTGEWSIASGGATISDLNDPNAIVNPAISPTKLNWTITKIAPNGLHCTATDQVIVTDYQPKNSFAGIDQTVCDFATMTANQPTPPEYGEWRVIQGNATFANSTYYQTTVTDLDYIVTNLLVWTLYNDRPGGLSACESTDTVSIISNKVYVNAGPNEHICNDSVQLKGNCPPVGGGEGSWSVTWGNATFSDYGTTCNSMAYDLVQGKNILRWTITLNGCDSWDEVEIWNDLPDEPDAGTPQTVCGSAILAATPDPSNPATIGTGTWKILSGGGIFVNSTANNSIINNLNFGPNKLQWTMTNGGCSLSDSVIITSDVVVANAGLDRTVCTDTTTLVANNPAPGTGTWIPQGTGATIASPNNPTTFVSNLDQGNNIFRWRIIHNSCTSIDDVEISNDQPTAADAGPDTVVCTSSVQLNANAPIIGIGHWETANAAITFNNSNDPNTTANNLPFGYTTFTWVIDNGSCIDSDDVVIRYVGNIAFAGPDDTICTNTTQLDAVDPAPETGTWTVWSGSGTFANNTLYNTNVTNINSVVNRYVWTVTIGSCIFKDTVTITNFMPTPANAGLDDTICQDFTNLNASIPSVGSGEWTNWPVGVTVNDPTYAYTLVSGLPSGANTFTWTVTNGICTSFDDVTIYNQQVAVSDAGIDQYVCSGTANICGNDPSPNTGYWDLVQGTGTIANSTSICTNVSNLGQGRNVFRWNITSGTGCDSYDYVNVYNLPVNAYAGHDTAICQNSYTLNGNNPATEFIPDTFPAWGWWQQIPPSAPGTILDSTLYNTTVTGLDWNSNVFRWTITNGYCTAWDEVTITNNMADTAFAGPDTIVCQEDFFLMATEPSSHGTGHWNVLAGGATVQNSTAFNSQAVNLDNFCGDVWTPNWWTTNPAPNIFEWVVEYNGCTSRDTVRVINGLPTPANAGIDDTVCSNETNLDALDEGQCSMDHWWEAVPASPTFWDPVTGVSDNTDFNSHVEDLPGTSVSPTTSTFIWHKTNTFGSLVCELTDTVKITSLGYEEQLNAGADDAVCAFDYKLSGTPPDNLFTTSGDSVSGYWYTVYGDGTFDETTLYNTWVRNMDYTTNIYRWTVYNYTLGCSMNDDVYITNALPSAAITGPDTSVCENQATLTATRPVRGTGIWTVVGGGSTIINPTCQQFNCGTYAINLGPGLNTFLWTVTNTYTGPPGPSRTCSLDDTLKIMNNTIVADAGATIYICADTAQLNASLPVGTTGQWNVTGGSSFFVSNGGTVSSIYNDVATNLTRGKNTFTWTISNGVCSNSDDLIVWDNLPYPNPSAGADQTVCSDSTTLTGNTITRSNVWYDPLMIDTMQYGYSTQQWTVWGTGTIDDPTSTNTWVHNIPAQTTTSFIWHAYYHFFDLENNYNQTCQLYDTVNIYNNSVNAEAGPSDFVCGTDGPGAQYQLGATQVTAPAQGIWSAVFNPGPSTIVTPSAYDTWVTNMQNGDHIYRWTVSSTANGVNCSAFDTVVIRVRIPSQSTVALPDSFEVCSNQANLQANIPVWGIGHWEDVYTGMGHIIDPNSNNTIVDSLWPGISKWAWVIDNEGCWNADTLTIVNNTVYADADDRVNPNIQNICIDTLVLSATAPGIFNTDTSSIATGVWSVIPGTVTFDNNTIYNTTVRNLSNVTSNLLRWRITKGGCTDVSQLIVNNNQFNIDADENTLDNHIYTCYDSIHLAGEQPGIGTGIWKQLTSGLIVTPTLYNTLVQNLNANDNLFEWSVTRNGCTAKDTVIVTNNKVTSQAGIDQTVCSDSTQLNAGAPVAPATGNWTTIVGGGVVTTPSLNNSDVTGMGTDLNQFIWTITKGACSANDTVNVWNNSPDDAVVESDKEVCSNTTTLTVTVIPTSGNGTGVWSVFNGAGDIVDSTAFSTSINNLQSGWNTILWTVTKGACAKVDTLNILNNRVVSDAGPNDTVCQNYGQLHGVDPSTFEPGVGVGSWTSVGGGGTVDNTTIYNSTVSNLGYGINRFRWTVRLGNCSASTDALLYNYMVTASASDIDTCDFPVALTGNNPATNNGLWKNIGGLGTVANPTLYNSNYSGLNSGLTNNLRWIIYNNSCADSIDILVTNNDFSISAGPTQTTCDDTIQLNADQPGAGIGFWSIYAGSGTFDNSTLYNTVVRNLGQGTNKFQWNVTRNGCTNSAVVTIIDNRPSAATITGPLHPESCDGLVTLTANHPTPYYATTQYWSQAAGSGMVGNPTDFIVTVNNLEPGVNTFVWTIENSGCTLSDTITIINNQVKSEAGQNQTICETSTYLNATDPSVIWPSQGTGHWEKFVGSPVNIINSLNPNTLVTDFPNGSTTLQWIVTLGTCSATDTVKITNRKVTAIAHDTTACSDIITLNGNDPSTFGGTGLWSIVSAASSANITQSTLYNSTITGIPNGSTATLQWRISNGICADSTQITVKNNNFTVSAGPNKILCKDNTTLLGDNPSPGTGYWQLFSGNATITDSTLYNTTVTDLGQGANTFHWIVTRNNCTNYGEVIITNNIPSDAIITSPVILEVCEDSVELSANHPAPYYASTQFWTQITGSGMVGNPTDFNVTVHNLEPGVNTFMWTVKNGKCKLTDTISIVNNQVTSVAGNNDTICENNTYLNATDPTFIYPFQGTGVWTKFVGSPAIIANSLNPNTYVDSLPNGTTSFQWTVTLGSCYESSIVQITNRKVTAIANNVTDCDDEIQLNGNDPSSFGGTGLWTIVSGSGHVTDSTLYNSTITGVPNGNTTTLNWWVTNNVCSDSIQITVKNNNFSISAGTNQTLCKDSTILNGQNPSPGSGYWQLFSGNATITDSTLYNTTVSDLGQGANTFRWIVTKNGCTNYGEVVITNNIPSEALITAPVNLEVCSDSVELSANHPTPFYASNQYWHQLAGGGMVGDPTDFDITVHNLEPGVNIFIWNVVNGACALADTITILNNQVVAEPGMYDTICDNNTYLNATDPSVIWPFQGTGHWTKFAGSPAIIANSLNPNTYVDSLPNGGTSFQWTVTLGNCIASDVVQITNRSVNAVANNISECDGNIQLNGNDPSSFGGSGLWTIVTGSGHVTDSTLYNSTITGIPYENTTTLQWLVTNNICSDSIMILVKNNGFVVNAGANDTLCTDSTQLNAQNPGTGSGYWSISNGTGTFTDSTLYNTYVTGLGNGENIFRWNVTKNNCSNSATVKVINNSPSQALITGPNTTEVCNGNVTLIADNPLYGQGYWDQVVGTGLTGTSSVNPLGLSGLSINDNMFTWTVKNWNCLSVDTIVITNNKVVSIAGNNDSVCSSTAYLNAVNPSSTIYGGTGHWVDFSGGVVSIANSLANYTQVSNLPKYSPVTFQWIVQKGNCIASSDVEITNFEVQAIASDTVACDTIATLSANSYINPPEIGHWSIGAPNAASFVDNPSNYNCNVTGLDPGTNEFTWNIENGVCSDSTTIFVTNNAFTVSADPAGNLVNICKSSYQLKADNPSPGIGYWEKISGPGTVLNSTAYNSTVTGLSSTATVLKWNVVKNGCTASAQVSIINNTITAFASPHLYTCNGTITLDGNNPSPGVGLWKKVIQTAGGNIVNTTLYNTDINSIPKETTVALRWVITSAVGGCQDSVQVLVTNNDFNLSAGLNDTTCADSIQLAADSPLPGTGNWDVSSGSGTFDDSTYNQTIVRGLGVGDNFLSWTVTKNGCTRIANVTITNNAVTAEAGFNQMNLCDSFTTITGNDPALIGGTGYWKLISGGGDILNSNNYSTEVYNLSRTENTFRWTIEAKGCTDFDDVIVKNNSFDVSAGLDKPVCADTAQLNAIVVTNGVGTWSTQGTTPATIDNNSLYNTVVRGLQQGTNTFRWTVSRSGCTFYDDVVITSNLPDVPMVLSPSGDTICIDSVQLMAVAPESGTTGSWSYTGSGGDILNINNNNTWAHNLNPGTTVFIWTVNRNGCQLSDSFTVTNDGVTSNAGGDQLQLCQNFASLNAVVPTAPANAWWTKADAQPNIIENSTSNVTNVTNLGYGQNKFVWNIQKGHCSATDTVIVINNSASPAQVGAIPPSCTGSTALSATPPVYGTGHWSYTGTYPVVIHSPNSTNTIVDSLEYGANLFTWTVVNTTAYATCTDDTSFVVVNNQFTISAGEDNTGCDTLIYLGANTRPDADSSYWEIITGTPIILDSNDPNSGLILGEGKSTVLKWTVHENGCSSSDMVTIQNKGVTAIANDKEVCQSNNVTLSAAPPSSGNSGYWTTSTPGVTFNTSSTLYNANVSGLRSGANLFTWHVYNPTCSDSIIVNVNYLVPFVDAGPSIPICDDNTVLSANDPSSYGGTGSWSITYGAGAFVNTTLNNTTIQNLDPGQNILRWTVTKNGCTNFDDVTITNNKPTISVGTTQNICNSTTTLTGNQPDSADSGLWTAITSGTFTIVDSTLYNTSVTGLDPGTYIFKWTVSNANCSASEQLIVNNNSVTADAGEDIPTCSDSVRLSASLPPNSTGYWTIGTPGPDISNTTLFNTWVTDLNADNNIFTWTVTSNGCTNSDFVVVTNNTVYVDAGEDIDICEDQTTLFGSNTSGGNGVWRRVSGNGYFLDSTSSVTTVYGLGQGANVFEWIVSRGICSNFDEVIVNNNEVYADAGSGDNALCETFFELNAIPAQTGETGYWTVVGGAGTIDNSTDYNTYVRNLARGQNVLRWTVSTVDCSNYSEITINNITPSKSITAPDKEICQNLTVITANNPVYGVGHWEKVSGPTSITIDNSTANSTWVRNLGQGPNKFAWIITDEATGCSTYDTIQVTNNTVTAFAGLSKEVCTDTFKLEATTPTVGYGLWTKVSSYGDFDNPSVNNTVVRNMGIGDNIYRWTVYSSSCSNSAEVIITNNTPTTANAGEDQISCNSTAVLVGSTPDVDETGLWSNISGGALIQNTTRYWTNISNLSYGSNLFTWMITRGSCTSIDTVSIVNNKINVYAGENQEVCTDSVFLKGNDPTFGTGKWSVSGGAGVILNSTNFETPVIGLASGVNTFKWTINDGTCSGYDEVQITNNEPTAPTVCYDTIFECNDYSNLCANLPPDGETGYWTLISGSGDVFDSSDPNTYVGNLSVNTEFVWTIKKGNCMKYDTTYIANGSVDAIVSTDTIEVCGTTGTLSANEPLHGTGTWKLISGTGTINNSTSYITGVTGLNEGANTFRWTVVDGSCSASDDMVLLNNKYPVTANMAGTNPICQPEVWVIGNPPSAGATGYWTFSAGIGNFDDSLSPATRAYDIGDGTNTVRWTIKKGSCENFAEFQIVNKTIEAVANSPVIVCSSTDTTSLTANDPSPGAGIWQIVSGNVTIISPNNFTSQVTDISYGSNSVKWTVSNGFCSDSAFVVVQNNSFSITAGSDVTVCDTSAVLQGSDPGGNGSGYWSIAGGHGIFVNSTSYNTVVNGLNEGINKFTWTVTKNGCTANADVVITNGLPTAIAGGDRIVCTDSVIMAATTPPIGAGIWTQTGGRGDIVNNSLTNTLIRNLGHGMNTFRWTVYNGTCQTYDDVTIYNNSILQTAGDNQNICDTFTTLAADPPGTNGHGYWTIVGGGGIFQNSTLYNTRVTALYDGVNTFCWNVSENGCSDTSNVVINNNRFDVYAGEDQIVTANNATLNATPIAATTGTWTIAAGAGTFSNTHDPQSDVFNMQYGVNTYRWTVYNSLTGCSAEDFVNITYNGFSVDAGATQYICTDTSEMDAVPVYNANTYWTIDLGSVQFVEITNPKTKVFDIAPGQNILRWNVTKNGFSTSDTVSIYNYMFEVNAGPDQYLCNNYTQLHGSDPINSQLTTSWYGQWIVSYGGGTFSDQNDPDATIYGLLGDTNTIVWRITRTNYPGTGLCQATDTVNIAYYELPQSDFAALNGITAGCSPLTVNYINTTSTVDTVPGTTYYWLFDEFGLTYSDYDDTVSFTFTDTSKTHTQNMTYYVTMTAEVNIGSGLICRDTAIDSVVVWPVPVADFAAYPINGEWGNATNVDNSSTSNAIRYNWSWGDGATTPQDTFSMSLSHTYDLWGDYQIMLTVTSTNGCTSQDSVTVHILAPEPSSYGNNNIQGCSPLNLQLYNYVSGLTPDISQYKWVINKDIVDTIVDVLYDPNPIYKFTDDGTYLIDLYVTAEGTNPPWSWTYIRTDTITVYPIPIADFEVTPMEIMANSPINLYNLSTNASRFLWDFGFDNHSVTDTSREPSFIYRDPGRYYISLQVWSKHGCTNKILLDVPIVVLDSGSIEFPTAFAPDPSGPSGGVVAHGNEYKNYLFRPAYYKGIVDYELLIFNRWGELIYQGTNPDEGWDGYIDKILAPQDVYVYICNVKFKNGASKTLKGSVTLLR